MSNSKNSEAKLAEEVHNNRGHDSLPDSQIDYYDQFIRIDNYLNHDIHSSVNVGATAREPIWLTDHGPEHIATVIRRAGDLVFAEECVITPYEAYILLVATHFHDIGNIFGREKHEQQARVLMFESDKKGLFGDDNLEKRMICDIAMAHGGYADIDGDKDTIGRLHYDNFRDKSKGVRVKKMAAILRFADELADDNTRTNRFVQKASSAVFPESEIFHRYASQLRPVMVHHDTQSIDLRFELNTELVTKKYRKFNDEKYLFDEILDRTLKMHREHVYCKRFMLPDIVFERINVHIDVCTENYSNILGIIRYTMAEGGYPDNLRDIQDICPDLMMRGEELKQRVEAVVLRDNGNSSYTEPTDLLTFEG